MYHLYDYLQYMLAVYNILVCFILHTTVLSVKYYTILSYPSFYLDSNFFMSGNLTHNCFNINVI